MAQAENITTTTPTRRAVLAGATAIATGAAANAVAITATRSGETNPYADLATRWRACIATWADRAAVYRRIIAEADRAAPLPEALRVLPGDLDLGIEPPYLVGATHYRYGVHELMGVMRRPAHMISESDRVSAVNGDPWPEKQARADEIVACYEEWHAKHRAHMESLGYDAEEREQEASDLGDDQNELEEEILAAPVTTMDEAIAKAKLVAEVMAYYDKYSGYSNDEPADEMARELILSIVALSS